MHVNYGIAKKKVLFKKYLGGIFSVNFLTPFQCSYAKAEANVAELGNIPSLFIFSKQ